MSSHVEFRKTEHEPGGGVPRDSRGGVCGRRTGPVGKGTDPLGPLIIAVGPNIIIRPNPRGSNSSPSTILFRFFNHPRRAPAAWNIYDLPSLGEYHPSRELLSPPPMRGMGTLLLCKSLSGGSCQGVLVVRIRQRTTSQDGKCDVNFSRDDFSTWDMRSRWYPK